MQYLIPSLPSGKGKKHVCLLFFLVDFCSWVFFDIVYFCVGMGSFHWLVSFVGSLVGGGGLFLVGWFLVGIF